MTNIQEAVVMLSRLCDGASSTDGQGFNKFDADFGHSLASQPRWSFKQSRAAHMMLRKYSGQLTGLGIDYGAIPAPIEEDFKSNDAKQTNARKLTRVGRFVHITWQEFSRDMTDDVKSMVPGAKWSKADRAWKVRLSPVTISGLLRFSDKYNFENSDKVKSMVSAFQKEAELRHSLSVMSDVEPLEIEKRMTMPLRPFQRAGIQYATRAKRCMIADEMGLGKTVQSIVSVEQEQAYPCICVVPAVVKEKWKREWNKWFTDKKVDAYIASGQKPESLKNPLYGNPDVIIINYDILSYWSDELKKLKAKSIIFDESHYMKNGKTKRAKSARSLARGIEHIYLLTGTPIENKTIEFASQLAIMDRLDDMGGWNHFAYHFSGAINGHWGVEYGPSEHLSELNASLRSICYVRRLKEEVAKDLPEKARCIEGVSIDNREEYDRVQNQFLAWIGDRAVDEEFLASISHLDPEAKEFEISMKRMNAAARASMAEMLVQLGALRKTAALGKINAARKWIENFMESGEKLIVFGWHRQVVEDLAEIFDAPKIIGGMQSDKRQANADRFMEDPNCKLIFCNIKAAGVGVDLYAASNVLFLELGWTPTVHDQAEARAHRIGQTKNVMSWYLLDTETIDGDMYELLEQKRAVVEAATDGHTNRANESIVRELIKSLLSHNQMSGGTDKQKS